MKKALFKIMGGSFIAALSIAACSGNTEEAASAQQSPAVAQESVAPAAEPMAQAGAEATEEAAPAAETASH